MSFSYYHPNFRSVLLPSAYSILYIFIFLVRNFPLIYLSISLLQLPGLTIISTIYTIFLSQISPISYFSLLWTRGLGLPSLLLEGRMGETRLSLNIFSYVTHGTFLLPFLGSLNTPANEILPQKSGIRCL